MTTTYNHVILPTFLRALTESSDLQKTPKMYSACTSPIMNLICAPPPPQKKKKKFLISIFLKFSWDGCNTQEKWRTKVMQHFGGGRGGANKVHYGRCASGVWHKSDEFSSKLQYYIQTYNCLFCQSLFINTLLYVWYVIIIVILKTTVVNKKNLKSLMDNGNYKVLRRW